MVCAVCTLELLMQLPLVLGRCFQKTEGRYRYKMCLFDMAMQGSTSLGTFRSWSASGSAPDLQAGSLSVTEQ